MSLIDHTAAGNRWLPTRRSPVSKVHAQVRQTVEAYRLSSYEAFAFEMTIRPAEKEAQGNSHGVGYTGTHFFHFQPYSKEERKVVVRLNSQDTSIVEICFQRKGGRHTTPWRPLLAYLRQQPIVCNPNRDLSINHQDHFKLRNRHQSDWWAANGKRFKFLELPRELRNLIYTYCIGPRIEPFPAWKLRQRTGLHVTTVVHEGLLYVNKQVSGEMQEQIYSLTEFLVVHEDLLSGLVQNRAFPIERLRHLTLAFEHKNFFKFFGLTIVNDAVASDGVAATVDQQEQAAEPQCLAWPSRARVCFWDMKLLSLNLAMPLPFALTDWAGGEHDCQRKVVDLMLEAAWPFVRGQPVTVTGYAKSDQKAAFEKKAAQAYEERHRADQEGSQACDDDEDGGVKLDGSETVEVEQSLELEHVISANLPLTCQCKRSCIDDWSPDDEDDEET